MNDPTLTTSRPRRFRKKPMVIEAMQYRGADYDREALTSTASTAEAFAERIREEENEACERALQNKRGEWRNAKNEDICMNVAIETIRARRRAGEKGK